MWTLLNGLSCLDLVVWTFLCGPSCVHFFQDLPLWTVLCGPFCVNLPIVDLHVWTLLCDPFIVDLYLWTVLYRPPCVDYSQLCALALVYIYTEEVMGALCVGFPSCIHTGTMHHAHCTPNDLHCTLYTEQDTM